MEVHIEEDKQWESHGHKVVSQMSLGQLEDFVKGWRQHFLDTAQPRHLPAHWSVDARVTNSSDPAGRPDPGAQKSANPYPDPAGQT